MLSYLLPFFCGIVILVTDQLTKAYFVSNFALGESAKFLPGLIDLVYIHNTGSAWGMFSGKRFLLIGMTVIIMVVCVGFLIKLKKSNLLMTWSIVLILSGGIGNLIDRIFRNGKVIDFLHFEFWPNFPVFNVADCAVVIGGGLLILVYILDALKEYKLKKNGLSN